MADCRDPLNDGHCKVLDQVLESVPQALDLAAKCKDCGWPVDEFIQQLEAQKAMATKAKAHFFPNRS